MTAQDRVGVVENCLPPAPARRRKGKPAGPAYRATEADCQRTVVDAAKTTGWLVHHTRPAQTRYGWRTPIQGHAGFPDLVLVHPGARRTLFIELKRRPEKLGLEQETWGKALISAGQVWRTVWVPEELDGFVQELADLSQAPRGVMV